MTARALAVLVLAALATAAIGLRLAAAPSGAGFRPALAAAPNGSLYTAAAGRGLLLLDSGGGVARRGALPTSSPLALAAGDALLLGAGDGLFVSGDGGAGWRRADVPARRFLAVAALGPQMLAAAWADGVWASQDAGRTWRRSELPAEAAEIQSIALGVAGQALAGALTGVLTSSDSGRTWTREMATPGRVTSVGWLGAQASAATWEGSLYQARRPGAGWAQAGRLAAGVWTYEPGQRAAATVSGLYLGDRRALAGAEVVAFADSDGVLYAGLAGGAIQSSRDGRTWRRVFQG